jgi:hypothetical protein|nr:MAG TPA: hypothetical protein [Caudoviricetes sp.]
MPPICFFVLWIAVSYVSYWLVMLLDERAKFRKNKEGSVGLLFGLVAIMFIGLILVLQVELLPRAYEGFISFVAFIQHAIGM